MTAARHDLDRRLLNTARAFERGAMAVRVPFHLRLRYWFHYLGLARRGVMLHSATQDAVYADSHWQRGYLRLCAAINRRLAAASPPPDVAVPEFAHGELDLAQMQWLMRRNVPFVIRGGAAALPARRWTLEYLDQVAGDCPVPINGASDRPSEDLDRPTKANRYYEFRTGVLAEVIASIRSGGQLRVSTAEDVMHHAGGRLQQDLDLAYWEAVSGWEQHRKHWLRKRMFVGKIVGAQLLLQPENAFTLWHAEPGDNFFVLMHGVKDWTLAHPYYTAAMQPRVKSTTNYHGSNIDVREPAEVQRRRGFGGYLGVPKVRVRLQPGDMLRVPNHWWHTVVTLPGSYTVAATIRSNSPPNRTGFGYGMLRLLDRQYHALAKAWLQEGRIRDEHIGYPRPSRGSADRTA